MLKILVLLNLILNAAPQDLTGLSPGRAPQKVAIVQALAPAGSPVLVFRSYREWKAEQLAYWQARGQAEMAKDLTVADYFAGYLTKQKDQAQAIKEVSGRLSPDEVAELMTIYANSVFGSRTSNAPRYGEISAK